MDSLSTLPHVKKGIPVQLTIAPQNPQLLDFRKEMPMKSLKKILLFGLGVVLIMMFFNSCESNETKEKRHAYESYQKLEECINSKDSATFREMFNSIGCSSLKDSDIDQLFAMFPSGITLNPTPYDDYLTVTDWIESGFYGKQICWSREIINNATGEHLGISASECVIDQRILIHLLGLYFSIL